MQAVSYYILLFMVGSTLGDDANNLPTLILVTTHPQITMVKNK